MGFQNIGPNYWEGEKGRKGILTGDEKFTDSHYVELFETLGKWSEYMADGYQAQTYPDSQNLFTLGMQQFIQQVHGKYLRFLRMRILNLVLLLHQYVMVRLTVLLMIILI